MKLTRISLAILVAAPFVAVNAGVTITPLLVGYTHQDTEHNNSHNNLIESSQGELKDSLFLGAALGVELNPWLNFEAEYTHAKDDLEYSSAVNGSTFAGEYKQQQINGNFLVTSDLITKNYDSALKPYVLLGAGHYKYKFSDGADRGERGNTEEGTLGNLGLGTFWRLNDVISLRAEARATYNIDEDFWNYTALTGLNVVLGGHLKPAKPIIEKEPIVQQPKKKKTETLEEPLNLELRVFFDTNKSNIKPQYQPEIAKVAEKLNEFTNATAQISGHTDNTGPRKLNERLSLARANSVKSALVNQYNIDASRLTTQGFAWDQPIADNKTKEGRALNRRVFATITGSRTIIVSQGE
ncbi:outer membrane protein Omp38 [Acinetobacter stercoris]|uniref:outer membrane protein Omp38 n=1 Tax=Acinetobacter stercoris TaxID=2126983 RepID=UPI001BC8902C|nr:OmpA family protein [Acinetobacter stercoris]